MFNAQAVSAPATVEAAEEVEEEEETTLAATREPEPGPPMFDEPGAGVDEPGSFVAKSNLAASVESELGKNKLWSTVEAGEGDELVIRSGNCGDDQLKSIVASFRARLVANGVARLSCYERYGSLVFEQKL